MANTPAERRSGMTLGGLGRRAFWVFASAVATLAVGYAASVITARVLGPEDRGLLAVLQTDAIVATQVLAFGIHEAVLYYGSRRPRLRPKLLGIVLVQTLVLALVAFAGVILFGEPLAHAQGGSFSLGIWLLAASLVPLGFLEYSALHLVQAELNFALTNRTTVMARFVVLLATILLVVRLGLGVTGALIALISFEVVQIAVYVPVAARHGLGFSMRVLRTVASYGTRIQLGALFRLASGRFDLILLSFFATHTTVGYYAIAQVVSELVLLLPRALGTVLLPAVASNRRADELSDTSVRLNGTLSLLALLAVAAGGPLLIVLGYGPAYDPALVPFLVLLPGIWFLSTGNLVANVLAAHGRPGTGSLLAALQAGLTIGLDLALIPPFGAVGAALASTLAYTVFGLASLVVLGRRSHLSPVRLLFLGRAELRAGLRRVRLSLVGR